MIISAAQILAYLDPDAHVKVVDQSGQDAFLADYARICELVEQGQICGKVRGSRLKYVELLVPISETITTELARASIGCKAQDSTTTYKGKDDLALTYNHNFRTCASYGGNRDAYRAMVGNGIS